MTKDNENIFLLHKKEHDNGEILQENMPTLMNFATKKFSSLAGTNNIVETGIKTFLTS